MGNFYRLAYFAYYAENGNGPIPPHVMKRDPVCAVINLNYIVSVTPLKEHSGVLCSTVLTVDRGRYIIKEESYNDLIKRLIP